MSGPLELTLRVTDPPGLEAVRTNRRHRFPRGTWRIRATRTNHPAERGAVGRWSVTLESNEVVIEV